jgi:hypothetical protein
LIDADQGDQIGVASRGMGAAKIRTPFVTLLLRRGLRGSRTGLRVRFGTVPVALGSDISTTVLDLDFGPR